MAQSQRSQRFKEVANFFNNTTKNNFKLTGANNSANSSRVEPTAINRQISTRQQNEKDFVVEINCLPSFILILDRIRARDHANRGDFPILGKIFICLKRHRFPKTGAIRAIDDQWMRAKRIARNDIRRAMSYREEPITRAVIYDCISVPFGRRRYIIRIPTRREFIYSIIIAYNR